MKFLSIPRSNWYQSTQLSQAVISKLERVGKGNSGSKKQIDIRRNFFSIAIDKLSRSIGNASYPILMATRRPLIAIVRVNWIQRAT